MPNSVEGGGGGLSHLAAWEQELSLAVLIKVVYKAACTGVKTIYERVQT